MKIFTRLLFLLAAFVPFFVLANVYVHGYVKYSNGTPAPGIIVYIQSDSTVMQSNCQFTHYRTTNSAGFYIDTLFCAGNISTVKTWVYNPCGGPLLIHDQAPTATNNVESNFIICDFLTNACTATFTWQSTGREIRFNSSSSHGAVYNDSIISRLWTFGDGTSLAGNVISPTHLYTQAGNYSVCLKTRTVSGCEKTVCNTVTVTATCNPVIAWQRSPVNPLRMLFNSSGSSTSVGDSIISRKWKFGDGDSLLGNVISPEHTYPTYGTYNVCLTIKTVQGCEKTVCQSITISNPVTSCHANFYFNYLSSTAANIFPVRFGANTYSNVGLGDSIIQYRWTFGDGTTGNDSLVIHNYNQPGNYTACLKITSASGCRDSICKTITIPAPRCEAVFTVDSIATPQGGNPAYRYYRFNSINSHGINSSDSVISRLWKINNTTTITGNVVSPLFVAPSAGTYNVCLYIQTASGCKDSLCKNIIVPGVPVTCQPRFAAQSNALNVTFNSSTSTLNSADSIISRSWTFGDGTSSNTNAIVLTHQYPGPGNYNACLTIRTRLGCVSTTCKQIAVTNVPGNCVPYFTTENVATVRTVRFNGSAAYSQLPNDSIIERKWEFGDGQVLYGNVINPLHTYLHGGTYNVCLKIRTALQCESRWCKTIQVYPYDTTATNDSVRIVNLYPVPTTTQLNTVIFSAHPNVNAVIAIYDVYGVMKWSQSVVLPYGNSTYNVPTAQLPTGPYIFRVTTVYGIRSRTFYKVI